MTVYRFSIPIFIVSRTPIIHTKMFKTNQLFKPRPSYKSLCRMNLVTVYFAGDLQIVSSHQTRTREIRTGNVTELKYTDKQTSCKKASVVYGTQNQKNSCPQASDVIYLFQSLSPLVINLWPCFPLKKKKKTNVNLTVHDRNKKCCTRSAS